KSRRFGSSVGAMERWVGPWARTVPEPARVASKAALIAPSNHEVREAIVSACAKKNSRWDCGVCAGLLQPRKPTPPMPRHAGLQPRASLPTGDVNLLPKL